MSMAYDDYVYCSPFLNVASLDHVASSDHFPITATFERERPPPAERPSDPAGAPPA